MMVSHKLCVKCYIKKYRYRARLTRIVDARSVMNTKGALATILFLPYYYIGSISCVSVSLQFETEDNLHTLLGIIVFNIEENISSNKYRS